MRDVEYNATVRFDADLPRPVIDRVIDELQPYGAVVGARPGRPGSQVVLTVDESSLQVAATVAVARVEAIAAARASSLEVLPTAEFDAR